MFWYPQFETIQDLIEKGEITEKVYGYYEIKTETYEKPKRTRKFYKNYISRRKMND